MELNLNLHEFITDDTRLDESIVKDLEVRPKLTIYSDTHDLVAKAEYDNRIISVWIEYGDHLQLMFDTNLDETEEFALALLNKIKIVRRNYSKLIDERNHSNTPV
jgi:hypothetical protein